MAGSSLSRIVRFRQGQPKMTFGFAEQDEPELAPVRTDWKGRPPSVDAPLCSAFRNYGFGSVPLISMFTVPSDVTAPLLRVNVFFAVGNA